LSEDRNLRSSSSSDAWLQLQAALGLSPRRLAIGLRGEPDPAALLRDAQLEPPLSRRALRERREQLERRGVSLVPYASRNYPARLDILPDPPPLLLVRGRAEVLLERSVAIVGSRAATVYGLAVASQLAGELARAGLVVLSGLARGVDAAAHRGALAAGGLTVAAQACGPERVYPRSHHGLADEICERGCVVTELPPGTPPRPSYFPMRNRLIAAMASAVVVVEARERSGSLVTVRHAVDLGVDVLAVPGPIHAPTSAGPNRLIREGAGVVLEARDVLEALGIDRRECEAERREAVDEASAGERGPGGAIEAALQHAPASRDELAGRLGCRPQEVALALCELELGGRARQDRDGRWTLVPRGR
jgi:DNA processing protein